MAWEFVKNLFTPSGAYGEIQINQKVPDSEVCRLEKGYEFEKDCVREGRIHRTSVEYGLKGKERADSSYPSDL